MTALAIVAKEMGIEITGSDVSEEFPTDATLHKFNITHLKNFSVENISLGTDLVIYTGAHQGSKNIEVQRAMQKNIPAFSHGKALGFFMQGKKGISVAGSHGKTTTSAMIAHILSKTGLDPSFAIGCGEILSLKTPAHAGRGEYFVAEADEYVTDPNSDMTPRFMWQKPHALVITNIDYDHPDVYPNIEAIQKAFITFARQVTEDGFAVINADDYPTSSIVRLIELKKITFGKHAAADFQLVNFSSTQGQTNFEVKINGKVEKFSLQIPGEHNCLNATATITTLVTLGLTVDQIRKGLSTFIGTKRRFEKIAEKNGKLLYDDYAHHPVEIAVTLKAAKGWFPNRRLIAIFQPHTYSRTQALLEEFSMSFNHADEVVICGIYASAREIPSRTVTSSLLVDKIRVHQKQVVLAQTRSSVLEYIVTQTRPNDLIITMGAGDIYTWLPQIELAL